MSRVTRWTRGLLGLVLAAIGTAHAGTVTYEYTDPQGSVLAEADAQGNIIARYDYRPYGGLVHGAGPNGPGYTGHVNDPETGLIYMQARYDDPGTGRFLSPDPVGSSPGDLFEINRYAYALNNPEKYTDPDGRCPWCAVIGAVSGAAIGATASYVASGGNWRAALAGGVGGAVGGAITGATLGAGSSLALTVGANITAGILGEGVAETTNNAMEHGTDVKNYHYSLGKLAVGGALGAVAGANSALAEQVTLSAAKKFILSQSVVVPAQLVSDQIVDNPGQLPKINLPVTESSKPRPVVDDPDQSKVEKDHLELK